MEWHKNLIVVIIGLSLSGVCGGEPLRTYVYISTPKSWEDAQRYCREKHSDLATFESIEDVNRLSRPGGLTSLAWFGLSDDPASWKGTLGNHSNSWRWSTTGQPITSQYHNWQNGQPNRGSRDEHCVVMDANAKWHDANCLSLQTFACYTDIGQKQKTYVFISEGKTWSAAQSYCRQHYTDLAAITSAEENSMVLSVKSSTYAWIGLSRVPWTWSDGSPCTFRRWLYSWPNNYNGIEHCIHESSIHQWDDSTCWSQRPFICQDVAMSKTTLKVRMKTSAALSHPAVSEQIIQKINAALRSRGWTDLKLGWTTPPRKAPPRH